MDTTRGVYMAYSWSDFNTKIIYIKKKLNTKFLKTNIVLLSKFDQEYGRNMWRRYGVFLVRL